MLKTTRLALLASALFVAGLAIAPTPLRAKEFAFDPEANREVARRLAIPVYFAVPANRTMDYVATIVIE